MRFHVVALPHTHVTDAFSACAFTMKVKNFCRMMIERGHDVVLYAGEQNAAPVTEHVVCIDEAARAAHVGARHYTEAPWEPSSAAWSAFLANAIAGIRVRAGQRDFICLIGGYAQKAISDAFPAHLCVEIGVGYGGCFLPFKVFESYAWMHTVYGARSMNNPCGVDGTWFDAVIPGYLDPAEFPVDIKEKRMAIEAGYPNSIARYGVIDWGLCDRTPQDRARTKHQRHLFYATHDKDTHDPLDYFLFVGRLIDRKGYATAQEVCRRLGKRLVLAGPGEQSGYGEFVGVVGPEERGDLMAGATAVFAPTTYIEPFGNVAIEAMACGTPVITTDWGAFTETNIHGVTGFRCRSLAEFIDAARRAPSLHRSVIRKHALDHYSLDVIGAQYERYFERLLTLWGEGWYQLAA
ncbi:glycosyltransferase [Kaistia nematophila]|uniref:Glycosyltransferase n=1 Tax=Kaistia nematophila TaxID=2994654 RepID=A0A9X3E2S5_9HYPH|nr:glycosyltransferase [Kaistia nematophila]MCX5569587.1 glycosyltransferase [Kaistia nematophila]